MFDILQWTAKPNATASSSSRAASNSERVSTYIRINVAELQSKQQKGRTKRKAKKTILLKTLFEDSNTFFGENSLPVDRQTMVAFRKQRVV